MPGLAGVDLRLGAVGEDRRAQGKAADQPGCGLAAHCGTQRQPQQPAQLRAVTEEPETLLPQILPAGAPAAEGPVQEPAIQQQLGLVAQDLDAVRVCGDRAHEPYEGSPLGSDPDVLRLRLVQDQGECEKL